MPEIYPLGLPRRPQPRYGARPARRWWIAALVVAVVAAGVVVPYFAPRAQAATTVFTINSPAFGGADASPGDGLCRTSAGLCTLRAAIEESNALKGQPGDILIQVDPSIQYGTKMTGAMNSDLMYTSNLNGQDSNGAQFWVTSPVIIDLGHRLQPYSGTNDSNENAVFYLNGPDIQLLNVDNALSSGSSFVIGQNALRVTIDGDTMGMNNGLGITDATAAWGPERFIIVMQGAKNLTVRNYTVSGYYTTNDTSGIFLFYNPVQAVPSSITQDVVFDNIRIVNKTTGSCGSSDGTGCNTRLLTFWQGGYDGGSQNSYANNVINRLTFNRVQVQYLPSARIGLQFANPSTTANSQSSDVTDLTITNCKFTSIVPVSANQQDAFLLLPYAAYLRGTTTITNNVFTTTTTGAQAGTGTAIYFVGAEASNSTKASNVTIANNYFNGWGSAGSVRTKGVGLVTVAGNTFGAATKSNSTLTEESGDTNVMYSFAANTTPYNSANQAILTWAPAGNAAVLSAALPAGALVVQGGTSTGLPQCTATVTVTKPTAGVNHTVVPADPVTLEVYWTGVQTAEVYLGKVSGVVGPDATLAVSLPVGQVSLPDGGTVTPVNPTTGVAGGFLRVQTHVEGLAQLESSQYSRVVSVTGSCRPALTVNQAPGAADPTVGRDLHFLFVSSVPLDPMSVDFSTFTVTAVAVPQTTDASRLNPQITAVTPVAGSGDTQWDVVARVDDSAAVSVTVGAGAVTSTAGLTNASPASSVDNTITFLNPIRVDPSSFTLVTGEPNGKDYTVSLAAGAPPPISVLVFAATVDQPQGTPPVTLSTAVYSIAEDADSAPPVTVYAAPGTVTANTPVTVTMTLSSADPEYNGLVVPTVKVYLFSTDPTIQITKSAYVNVSDPSTPTTIEATGTYTPRDSRLLDGQAICFVYTVTNTSADDWATTLSNVVVTDSDTRLGKSGVIGTIPTIPMGQWAKLAACTSIQPVDTTVGGGTPG